MKEFARTGTAIFFNNQNKEVIVKSTGDKEVIATLPMIFDRLDTNRMELSPALCAARIAREYAREQGFDISHMC